MANKKNKPRGRRIKQIEKALGNEAAKHVQQYVEALQSARDRIIQLKKQRKNLIVYSVSVTVGAIVQGALSYGWL